MAMRVVGRVRTLRRLVTAVISLCDPQGSTAHEIIEWCMQHPCGKTRCQHSPFHGIEVQKDRARLMKGLRHSVKKGVLEKHGDRYKLAMEGRRRPQPPPWREARPRVRWARSGGGRSPGRRRSRRCRACALSSGAGGRQRRRSRHPTSTSSRRRPSAARAGRRRQQASRRRHPAIRHLRSGRDRTRGRTARRVSAKEKAKPSTKDSDKGKGKGDGSASASGGGGCVGCGQRRPDRAGEQRRASHLMFT